MSLTPNEPDQYICWSLINVIDFDSNVNIKFMALADL